MAPPLPNLNVFPDPIKLRKKENKAVKMPRVSREIAMKLVLHEVKRLSTGFVSAKVALETMQFHLAEETVLNEHKTIALNVQQERLMEKEQGLAALYKILLNRYGQKETGEILHELDMSEWCNLFANSSVQLVNPPDEAIETKRS